ncbi:nucleotidyltransferase [bacterium]|nr:nucleotidyltransferase [bacterium]
MLNEDYRDMLRILSEEKVEFLLVGAYALAVHGYLRATMDIDLWVMPSPQNAEAVLTALQRFGAPLHEVTHRDFEEEGTVFQIGIAPRRIDILTSVTGLEFNEVYARSTVVNVDGIDVHVPPVEDLITNKRSTGRTRDLADVEALEAIRDAQTDI